MNTNSALTDFDYEQHKLETPDDYVRQLTEGEDIYNLSKGDQIWIDGTEYTVISSGIDLITPPAKRVIGEDGSQHELIAGKVPSEDVRGVTWLSKVTDKTEEEISRSVLIAKYDEVYITDENEDLESIHKVTPDSSTRECPQCDNNHGGKIQHVETQNNKAIEIRRCTNTDCNHIFRYTQPIDHKCSAELLFRDHRGEESFSIEKVTGFFEVEDQDDYKFPLDTNDGLHDGYRTAAEIAEFLNPKMVTLGITDLLTQPEFDPTALLDLLTFTSKDEEPDWGKILVEHYKNVDTLIDLAAVRKVSQHLSTDTPAEFIDTLYTFYNATHTGPKDNPDSHEWADKDIVDADRLADIIISLINNTEITPQTPEEKEAITVFEQDRSGRDVLTSTPFYRLLTKTAEEGPVGKVAYSKRYNISPRSNPDIQWVDTINKRHRVLQKTYSHCTAGRTATSFGMSRMWGADDYDMTEFMVPSRQTP